jgi:predicted Ser/Thr protein kinase
VNNVTCPNDEELMPVIAGETAEGSLEQHLRDCSSCRRKLDLYKSDLKALRAASAALPPPPLPRPARIGKYLVVGQLDSGGQADVYRALHPALETEVAIKLSHRAVGRLSDHRTLLIAEGKLLARLDHPGLARVFDLDFHEDQPFLAMEYVRGLNLRKYLAEGAITPLRAAEIVADVGRAVSYVHTHGVIHQDIKPQNILMDDRKRPRLIDFGLARLRHAWDDSSEEVTGGTPSFMAPEQARMDGGGVGKASDIFAVGGVLYFLLTGQPPFTGSTREDVLKKAAQCEFDRAALNRPGVPQWLRTVCLKAMAVKPADRYARVDDLVDEIDRRLKRPHQVARAAGYGAAAILVIGTAIGISRALQDRPGPEPVAQAALIPSLELKVDRDGVLHVFTADPTAIPDVGRPPLQIRPQTDHFQIVARIPAGHHAHMLQIDASGKITDLKFRSSTADGYTKLTYPAEEGKLGTFDLKPGTEVILVFASANPDDLKLLDVPVTETLSNLPAMSGGARVVVNENEASRTQNRPELDNRIGPGESDPARSQAYRETVLEPAAGVEAKLDELRLKLRGRNLSVLRGLAYTVGAGPAKK